MSSLHVLCAGAARGLVTELGGRFRADTGFDIDATFGAVGTMKEKLLSGAPCDLIVLTEALIDGLERDGLVDGASRAPLGRVHTGIAVRAGEPLPDISDADALRATLMRATAIYLPDSRRATAGIHFLKVLQELQLDQSLRPLLREHPNGAQAMQALAQSGPKGSVGCTQVTEINYTEGVVLAGPLPPRFDLVTVYTTAICTRAREPAAARLLAALISGTDSAELRARGGFEPGSRH